MIMLLINQETTILLEIPPLPTVVPMRESGPAHEVEEWVLLR